MEWYKTSEKSSSRSSTSRDLSSWHAAGKGNSKRQGPRGRNLLFGLHERILPHVYFSPSRFLSASPPPPVPGAPALSWKSFQGSRTAPADTFRERWTKSWGSWAAALDSVCGLPRTSGSSILRRHLYGQLLTWNSDLKTPLFFPLSSRPPSHPSTPSHGFLRALLSHRPPHPPTRPFHSRLAPAQMAWRMPFDPAW